MFYISKLYITLLHYQQIINLLVYGKLEYKSQNLIWYIPYVECKVYREVYVHNIY